jgi:hypothetical protein
MRVCGVELKGNDAVFCLLSKSGGLFDIADCRVRHLPLKENSRESLKEFQFAFTKLMDDYQVGKVFIRERLTKGKFAGSAVGFKMEAAIQLIDHLDVELLSPMTIKEAIKNQPLTIRFADTGLKNFQEGAFMTVYASLA